MHPFRIPTNFDIHISSNGVHFGSAETVLFWLGVLLALAMGLSLLYALKPGGEFHHTFPFLLPTDRKHPIMFWFVAVGHIAIIALAIDWILSMGMGFEPWFYPSGL
jgi:uncharacterized protein HemY